MHDLRRFFLNRLEYNKVPLKKKEIAFIAKQIFLSLDFLHSNDMVHGDLKMNKILIKK